MSAFTRKQYKSQLYKPTKTGSPTKVSHATTMSTSISSEPFSWPAPLKNYDAEPPSNHPSPASFFNYHRNDSRYDLNGRIMLTAIISLSAVVLLVLALHVYARYALRRHARLRRESLLRRLSLSASPAAAASASTSAKPRGLDPAAIASLPPSSLSSSDDCAVCLGAAAEGEPARQLPGCGHAFHAQCIDVWLASQASCPVCRAVVDPQPPPPILRPEPREPPPAPPVLGSSSSSFTCVEVGMTSSSRCGGGTGSSRFSSFRRMITTREKSSSRRDQEIVDEDLERQS